MEKGLLTPRKLRRMMLRSEFTVQQVILGVLIFIAGFMTGWHWESAIRIKSEEELEGVGKAVQWENLSHNRRIDPGEVKHSEPIKNPIQWEEMDNNEEN